MKKVPSISEILQEQQKKFMKEIKYLQDLFMVHKSNSTNEIMKQFRLEQETLKKYDCKDTSEMIQYIVDLEFLCRDISNKLYFIERI